MTPDERRQARFRFAQDHIRKIVDGAPPLTETQRARLAALLFGARCDSPGGEVIMTDEKAREPLRAIDDPVKLAKFARIMRQALARKGLNFADLAKPEALERLKQERES